MRAWGRKMEKGFGCVLFAVMLLGSLAIQAAEKADRPPNIVLIVSDDQGYPDLGVIGTKKISTPNLDRLAREGLRATSFYVTWPACTPSRGSLLTGRYPQRNGLYDMIRNDMVNYGHQYTGEEYAVSPEMTLGLDAREITVGDVLKRAGYRTGMVGKWDMGQAKRFLPLQRGFDFFYGHGNNGIDYYTHERYGIHSMFRGNERIENDRGTYATSLFRREALRFLRENHGEPFFLYLAFNAPHSASSLDRPGVQAPEECLEKYPDRDPEAKLTRYLAAVTCMDEAIGEVMAALKEYEVDDETLVIFFSDNGGSGNGGNAPLKGGKSTMWEGGLRVPFIAWWPGVIPAGRVTDDFLTALEVFPTLVDAAGAERPKDLVLDGFNMLAVLKGKEKPARREMFWQRRKERAARVGHWKWVDSSRGGGLFDLSEDIGETNDLSKKKPEVLEMVKNRFEAWRREMDESEPRGPFRNY